MASTTLAVVLGLVTGFLPLGTEILGMSASAGSTEAASQQSVVQVTEKPATAHATTTTEKAVRATWYGAAFHGKKMANGQPFDQYDPGCAAHPKLPFGTKLLVTNTSNGRSLTTKVCDRGPAAWTGASIDLSRAGAEELGFRHAGIARVVIQVLGP